MPLTRDRSDDPRQAMAEPGTLLGRYTLALGLILCFVLGSHFASLTVIHQIKQSSELISTSINQRAAVQQIVSFSEMARTLRTQASIDRLNQAVDRLEQAHVALSKAAAKEASVSEVYFSGGRGPALDPIIRKFIADARIVASSTNSEESIAAALHRLRSVGATILPRALQEANEAHQLQAKVHSGELEFIQSAALALAVLVLFAEAVFIFLPAHRAVRRSFEALSAQARRLEQARAAIATRNRDLESLRQAAEYEAQHDVLTDLVNRRGFEREIELLTRDPREPGKGVAILHIDLDRFKEINDTLGHAAGDAVLRHVGQVLKQTARDSDLVARIGGDEFAIVRESDGDREQLSELAAEIVSILKQPIEIDGSLCQFGASIGIEIGIAYDGGAVIDGSRLIANADIALYRAKELGRGQAAFFSTDLRLKVEESKALSDDMSLGLMRGEFFPVYQPQICVDTGRICGVEALARWRHPTRGELSPGVFLPVADRLRKSGEIDKAIQQQALRDLAKWDELGLGIQGVSLNVSASRIVDPDFLDYLTTHPLARDRVRIEVLETVFTDDIDDELHQVLLKLTEAGIDVEIDDFGTGHASLIGLLSLRPSRLKIARELVAPLPGSAAHASLVRAVCDIGRSLSIGVTAEGVETEDQQEMLTQLGCDRMQGFFFARPMTSDALIEKILADTPPGARLAS